MRTWNAENNIMKISHCNNFKLFEICEREMCGVFVCKHSEAIGCVNKLGYFKRNLQTSYVNNNTRILWIKNAKFSGYCF